MGRNWRRRLLLRKWWWFDVNLIIVVSRLIVSHCDLRLFLIISKIWDYDFIIRTKTQKRQEKGESLLCTLGSVISVVLSLSIFQKDFRGYALISVGYGYFLWEKYQKEQMVTSKTRVRVYCVSNPFREVRVFQGLRLLLSQSFPGVRLFLTREYVERFRSK